MSKKETFAEIRKKITDTHKDSINYDELSAYILTLLQYNIQVIFNREDKVIGVGPRGVIYRLGNMLFQYSDYPDRVSVNSGTFNAYIDGITIPLFESDMKVKRPAKKGCSFGATLEEIAGGTISERHIESDLEFE